MWIILINMINYKRNWWECLFDIRSDINHINTISDREEHEFFFQSLPRKDIELLYCGYERCKPGHKYGPIMRDHFYYHFIESGSGIFRNNNAEFKVSAFLTRSFIMRPILKIHGLICGSAQKAPPLIRWLLKTDCRK